MSPNKNFRLDIDDIELIENALRNELKKLADQNLMYSESIIKDELSIQRIEDKMRKIHDLLGKIHNQKIWYRPKNYVGG